MFSFLPIGSFGQLVYLREEKIPYLGTYLSHPRDQSAATGHFQLPKHGVEMCNRKEITCMETLHATIFMLSYCLHEELSFV